MSVLRKKLDCLVNGYVLTEIFDARDEFQYAQDLNVLITAFCGDILIRFDVIYPKYLDYINGNGTIFRRPMPEDRGWVQFSVCSSIGFEEGVHEFRIKCNNPKNDAIGITSNTSMCTEENKWFAYYDSNSYVYDGNGSIWCTSKTENVDLINDQNGLKRWQYGSIIGVHIDCNRWILHFSHNDEQIGNAVNIIPGLCYHAFIGSSFHDAEYELLV